MPNCILSARTTQTVFCFFFVVVVVCHSVAELYITIYDGSVVKYIVAAVDDTFLF